MPEKRDTRELGFAVKRGSLRAEACSCVKIGSGTAAENSSALTTALRLRCCGLRKQRELRRRGGLLQHGLELGNECDALVTGQLGKVLLAPFDRGQSIGFRHSE